MLNTLKTLALALLNATLMLVLLVLIFAYLTLGRIDAISERMTKTVSATLQPLAITAAEVQTSLAEFSTAQVSSDTEQCPNVSMLHSQVVQLRRDIEDLGDVTSGQVAQEIKASLGSWLAQP